MEKLVKGGCAAGSYSDEEKLEALRWEARKKNPILLAVAGMTLVSTFVLPSFIPVMYGMGWKGWYAPWELLPVGVPISFLCAGLIFGIGIKIHSLRTDVVSICEEFQEDKERRASLREEYKAEEKASQANRKERLRLKSLKKQGGAK